MRNVTRRARWAATASILLALGAAAPARAASGSASCVGQEVSVAAQAFGSGFGAGVSFEAQHPELEGLPNLGAEVQAIAHPDRQACPEE